ncbi:MAG TPA: hypothetical protein VEQ85_14610 [Lacipirellulaceae bacterium]|nr:hypothetical protein [Lacipirellulaceae bacterium]
MRNGLGGIGAAAAAFGATGAVAGGEAAGMDCGAPWYCRLGGRLKLAG